MSRGEGSWRVDAENKCPLCTRLDEYFLDNSHGRVVREAEASLRNVLSKSCLI